MSTIGIVGPWRFFKRAGRFRRELVSRNFQRGNCPVCERRTLFVHAGSDPRESFLCFRCLAKPRWRALAHVLQTRFPDWRERRIYEASPSGPASAKLAKESGRYTPAHFYPGVAPGSLHQGFRCENLEALTFPNQSFDLVVSQDVLEHIPRPAQAFREIARVLAPGGAHVFTVPLTLNAKSVTRARMNGERLELILEKVFHGNPIDGEGSLVFTDWGQDLPQFVERESGLATEIVSLADPRLGLNGEPVVVSRKPENKRSAV